MSDETVGLEWNHKVTDLRERRRFMRTAKAEECVAISAIFGDAECKELRADYEIRPLAPGRYRMVGNVRARVGLICGVTLEPLDQVIDENFDVEFRRDARRPSDLDAEFDALADDDPEPIVHGLIEAGRFICEVVASVIDPFPRAEDAALEQNEAGEAIAARNPFAVLGQLKK